VRIFRDHAHLAEVLGGVTKWDRTLQALRADGRLPGVMYTVGDSLTAMRTRTSALATDDLVARRRYQYVLSPVGGNVEVDVAPVSALDAADVYSDLTDRQHMRGDSARHTVPRGAVLVADPDEAVRLLPTPDITVFVAYVTVEGVTFHNK
jgi:evolved beta-galactosidase subunit beta